MVDKKRSRQTSGERQTGNRNTSKDTKIKRTRIYPPQRKYILVSRWNPANNVLTGRKDRL